MSFASLMLFVGVMLTLAIIPSASVMLVIMRSSTHGLAHGVSVALGIALGDIVFACLALAGMVTLAESLGGLFVVLRYLAGLYLIWLGIGLIRSKTKLNLETTEPRKSSLVESFGAGFLLTMGDVKAIFFYASLFPSMFDLNAFGASDIVLILAITAIVVSGVKIAYALLARKLVARFRVKAPSSKIRVAGGCAMIGAGSYVILKP